MNEVSPGILLCNFFSHFVVFDFNEGRPPALMQKHLISLRDLELRVWVTQYFQYSSSINSQ